MKKILAFVLTLAMMLTLLNVGLVASAAPEGTAITDVAGLRGMAADQKYYLANDITLTSADVTTTTGEGDAAVTTANPIVLPDGVTLDGNGKTVFFDLAVTPAEEGQTKSGDWASNLFAFAVGATDVVIKNLNFGSAEKPLLLSANTVDADGRVFSVFANDYAAVAATADAAEVPATSATWENVNFYANREGSNLANKSFGVVMAGVNGTHSFTNCSVNGVLTGKDVGGWFYELFANADVTLTGCVTNGTVNAAYAAGFLRRDAATSKVAFINCTNNAWINSTGSHVGGFVATAQGPMTLDGCVNNGTVTGGAHLGGLIGTMNNTGIGISDKVIYKNNVNNGLVAHKGNSGGYVGGHIGNMGRLAITFENCVNNGEVSSTRQWTGGIVGRMANEYGDSSIAADADGVMTKDFTLSFVNCVNTGYVHCASKRVDGLTAANGDVAGLIGTVYPQLKVRFENCVNYGQIGSGVERIAGGLIAISDQARTLTEGYLYTFVNCVNYGKISASNIDNATSGGLFGYCQDSAIFENCVNYGDVQSEKLGVGGFVGYSTWRINRGANVLQRDENGNPVKGEDGKDIVVEHVASNGIKFVNCVNFGDVTAPNNSSVPAGGIYGKTDGAVIVFENVKNYGTVTGQDAAGIMGVVNAVAAVTVTNAANYGTVNGTQVSGGIVGWHKGGDGASLALTNCVNYADVTGANAVAGIVGQPCPNTTLDKCVNVGDISGTAEAEVLGGLVGRIPSTTAVVTISNSANVGTVNGSAKVESELGYFATTVGQLIGGVVVNPEGEYEFPETPVISISNSYAYGAVVLAENACVKAAEWDLFYGVPSYTDDQLDAEGNPLPATIANDGLFGGNIGAANVTAENVANGEADVAKLNVADFGMSFVKDYADEVVVATPAIRGYQTSEVANGKLTVRIAAVAYTNNVDAYAFEVTTTETKTVAADKAYAALNAGEGTVAAADYSAAYFFTVEVEIAAEGEQVVTVAPSVTMGTTEFDGAAYTLTFVDGVCVSVAPAAVAAE